MVRYSLLPNRDKLLDIIQLMSTGFPSPGENPSSAQSQTPYTARLIYRHTH